ncbi:TRAP transporter large permease [Gemmobacter sp.]|uniref:TRAP transporter large permease n=1 Tax=Gemmobacter sp. TaxID=1898957 RepID=UPI002AFF33C1|nr:TRAP transporter large permease [Gemmobacter sp.]
MDPLLFAILCLVVLLVLVFIGVPVALSIFSVAIVGMVAVMGERFMLAQVKSLIFAASSNYAFAVVPMFVLMGEIAGSSRIISDLYMACYRWIGALRGGVYNATVLASAGFAAISGSTVVNAAVFTRVALPEIERLGLNRAFGVGCIAASGTLAAMIPPSLTMVLYGILTDVSIGKILVAGILPGFLTAAMLMLTVWISALMRRDLMPAKVETFTLREKTAGLVEIWPAMMLAAIIFGGIYTGTVSPSAAGTIGVAGALLIAVLKRRMTLAMLGVSVRQAVIISAALFVIILAGMLFSRLLLVSGAVIGLTDIIATSGIGYWTFIAAVIVIYFVMGMFIDPVSMMVITLPFLYPTARSLGVDPIWFGIIVVKLVEIAAITPPIGINLFAVISASGGRVTSREAFVGVLPFVAAELVVLGLLLSFPAISTYLPGTMM